MRWPLPRGKGEPRVYTAFRCSPRGRTWLDDLTVEHSVDLSFVLRACLAIAKTHEKELKMLLDERTET